MIQKDLINVPIFDGIAILITTTTIIIENLSINETAIVTDAFRNLALSQSEPSIG